MRKLHRVISALLCLALTAGLFTAWVPAAEADEEMVSELQAQQSTGTIALTLAFGLPQRVEETEDRDITLQLTGDAASVTVPLRQDGEPDGADDLSVTVEALNTQGTQMTTEQRIGYYRAAVSGLPLGDYTLTLTGRGYVSSTVEVSLRDYSQHVLMSTADGTFSLGDVTGDDRVDADDRSAMDAQLGLDGDLDRYDLNGDGRVDIVDLSYVNKTMDLTGEPTILSTAAIVTAQLDEDVVTITDGSLSDLFTGQSAVTLAPAREGGELSIPIEFEAATEMQEISIASPSADGAIQAGTAEVELENGEILEIPFDVAAPDGLHGIGRSAGQSVVTINLGSKVAVKKVTIRVSRVEGQAGETPSYATVTQIEFLKDIVSDAMAADTQVKNLAAVAGDGQVELVWDSVSNVTGYQVAYGTDRGALEQVLSVASNRATVSGLKNNTLYYFQVTAVNGDWNGTPSALLSATPQPASAPGAPSNVLVEAADGALRVSWGSTKDAAYYQVYYREQGASEFLPWGGNTTVTAATITDLVNGTAYEVAVRAGNVHGVGPYSATALGTPKKEGFTMPELPGANRIDNKEIVSIVMEDPQNINKTFSPNFQVGDLIDNDPNTYWVAQEYYLSSCFTYTFANPHDMNYLLLVPYLSAKHSKVIKTYTVELRNEAGELLLKQQYRAPAFNAQQGYLILAFPEVEDVKSVSLHLGEVEGGGARVSISEIAFYESDTLSGDIAGLFTDGTFTALRGGVEQAEIAALQARLSQLSSFYLDRARLSDELALAQSLLDGDTDALGVVKDDFQSRSPSAQADRQAGQTASDLQPLGITAKAGSTVAVYAQLPDDATVYVVPTQFYGESGVWKGTPVALKNGRNYITVEKIGSLSDMRGGALYLTYDGEHPQEIRLQIRGDAGVYPMAVLELSDWYERSETQRKEAIGAYIRQLADQVAALPVGGLTTDIRNATELSTPSVLLSLPADQVLEGLQGVENTFEQQVETLYQNILAWEETLFVANKTQGIIDSDARLADYRYPMTTRQNIRYMRMFAGAFMYAAGNHVGVEYGSTAALVQGRPTAATTGANGLFGWGIAHEIGHNMDKLGRAEITNNLYSLALQAWNGSDMTLDTRLTESDFWGRIFEKTAQGRPGAANNVFVQLGMYWQLHLAYDEADQPLAFYNAFFRLWKDPSVYSGHSYDERVALIAAQVADRDLTEFFTRWGMTLSDGVKDTLAAYPDEPRAIWYLNDASRTGRLNGGEAADGSVSVEASVDRQEVTLTITHTDRENVLGYEIRRNGTAVGFTTEDVYVDDLGAANNLTYTYTVVPVDRLGNPGEPAGSREVRVAYDVTIDPDRYTLERSGDGAVTITLHDGPVDVTGIRVTHGSQMDGAYTVQATVRVDGREDQTVTVQSGDLEGTELTAYFRKPGASEEDARIWTYSVLNLTITGLPEDADVALLDYPGDRVDFHQGAAVGVLRDEYRYGDQPDQVIPAGTLVILGTYRGNPAYNYVEIEARYTTTPEAGEASGSGVTTIERTMNGYGLLFAEVPADGVVSDTSDGFFLFVPDLDAEAELNGAAGVTDPYPLEIRAVFYRSDDPESDDAVRVTSRTLWISFPDHQDGEDGTSFPVIALTGSEFAS